MVRTLPYIAAGILCVSERRSHVVASLRDAIRWVVGWVELGEIHHEFRELVCLVSLDTPYI
jgi:hypothetical protein